MKLAWLAALAGCGRLHFDPVGDLTDAPTVLGPWSSPTELQLGMVGLDDPSMTGDGLEIYVNCGSRICGADRATTSDPWPSLVPLASVPGPVYSPHLSYDGLTMWLVQIAATTQIYVTTRNARTDSWAQVQPIAELASTSSDDGPAVTNDGLVMAFDSDRSGRSGLYLTTRATTSSSWAAPTAIAEVNAIGIVLRPHLSDDRLTLYFQGPNTDIWSAHRASPNGTFDPPAAITEVNSPVNDYDPWVSADQRLLLLSSLRGGESGPTIWQFTR